MSLNCYFILEMYLKFICGPHKLTHMCHLKKNGHNRRAWNDPSRNTWKPEAWGARRFSFSSVLSLVASVVPANDLHGSWGKKHVESSDWPGLVHCGWVRMDDKSQLHTVHRKPLRNWTKDKRTDCQKLLTISLRVLREGWQKRRAKAPRFLFIDLIVWSLWRWWIYLLA